MGKPRYSISGTIIDQQSKGIRGVQAFITCGKVHRHVSTDDNGRFTFSDLPSGNWEIRAGTWEPLGQVSGSIPNENSGNIQITASRQVTLPAQQIPREWLKIEAEKLEAYGKLLASATAILTGVGATFKDTIFEGLSELGTWALALGVLAAALSIGAAVGGIWRAVQASAETDDGGMQRPEETLEKARWWFGTAAIAFGVTILLAGSAPSLSLLSPHLCSSPPFLCSPPPGSDARYGIAYVLDPTDTTATLQATFQARALPPLVGVRFFPMIGDRIVSPQAGGVADDSGRVSLTLITQNPCEQKGDTARLVAEWEPDGADTTVVRCPTPLP